MAIVGSRVGTSIMEWPVDSLAMIHCVGFNDGLVTGRDNWAIVGIQGWLQPPIIPDCLQIADCAD